MPSEVKAMIMCDECGIRPANIHLTTIVDGEKKDVNLCAECLARKKELKIDFSALAGTIGQMLTSGVPPVRKSAPDEEPIPDLTCENCGTSYEAFLKTGCVGCAQCYEAFRQPLSAWLVKRAGGDRHAGRHAGGMNESIEKKMRVSALKRRQKQAIAEEDYEAAAALRDQIRALNGEGEAERHE